MNERERRWRINEERVWGLAVLAMLRQFKDPILIGKEGRVEDGGVVEVKRSGLDEVSKLIKLLKSGWGGHGSLCVRH